MAATDAPEREDRRGRLRRDAPAAGEQAPRGFYAEALSEAERADLGRGDEVEGVDEEIALLRLRLRSAHRASTRRTCR